MGGGAQSKQQTHVFTNEKQLWCSGCYKAFDQPVKLGCGHKVCGPTSKNKCVEKVVRERKCLVANCGFKLLENFDARSLKPAESSEISEYDVAFQLHLEDRSVEDEQPSTSREPQPSDLCREYSILKKGPKGFQLVDNVYGNGRKKLLVIGKTGTGKSTLCNVIAGLDPNCDAFPVSGEAVSCTQKAQFGNIYFNGNSERPISLIDTIGFSDPDNDEDAHVISDIVAKLRKKCDYVNLFAIVVNGQNPRLDGSLVGMIRIFEEMFGQNFWKQVVVIFSRLKMDTRTKDFRIKSTKSTDDERAKKYIKTVESKFPKGSGLKYLLLDAWHQDEDETEKNCFDKAVSTLWDLLQNSPGLKSHLVQKVETEHAKLRKTIDEQNKQLAEEKKERKEFEEYKKQQESEREAERKERLREREEMEKRHLDQLERLIMKQKRIETDYGKKQSDLRLNLSLELDQKQREQTQLRENVDKQSEDKQRVFENELKNLKEQQESLLQKVQQQGDADKKLREQITTLELQQKNLNDKHVKEKQSLEADYLAKSKNFEKEKQQISSDYQQKNKQLQDELEKLKAQTEVELRAKQMNELAERTKSNQMSSTRTSSSQKKEDDEWRKKALGTFKNTEGDYWERGRATHYILGRAYPDSHWSVFAFEQLRHSVEINDVFRSMSNGGREAMDKGWEDEETWRDISAKRLFEKERLYTLYIWRALKSNCTTSRKLIDKEEKKVEEIIGSLIEKEQEEFYPQSVTDKNGWSIDKWRDELVQHMNNTQLLKKWKHITVFQFLY